VRSLSIALISMLALAGVPGVLGTGQDRADPATAGSAPPSCQVRTPEITGPAPSLLTTELPDGTLVLGGSYVKGGDLVTVLHEVLPDCQPVRDFGVHGTATVSLVVRSARAVIDAIRATASGTVLLAGGVGSDVLVGRLLPDGLLDASFGTSGWARLGSPVMPSRGMFSGPAVTSMTLGPSGSVYLGGDDGTAHCCVEDFVGSLSSTGRVESSFGDHGWAVLPALAGSYETDMFAVPGGLLVMGFVMYTGCGGPVLDRLGTNGRPDQAFAQAARHAVATASPGYALLPALYLRPGGAFAMVGELMPSGCLLHMPKAPDHGLALGFLPDGHVDPSFGSDGEAQIPSDGSASTWAVPRPDGSTFVVTEHVPADDPYGEPRALKVRELSAAGALERAFGLAGTTTIDLSWASAPSSYPSVDALPGVGGAVVIVVAAKQETKIYEVGR
jgi:hypothetical protein